MDRSHLRRALLPAVLLALLLSGCGRDRHDPVRPVGQAVPDFALLDLNPNSATTGRAVSPRQHVGKVSAWYFGHST
jgi:hypothetical protein